MTTKKPLVITNGQLERLQPGDSIDLSRTVDKTNNSGGIIVKATPVYISGGNASPAQANGQATTRVAGLAVADAADAAPIEVQVDGILDATTAEWDAITGQVGGLTEGAPYYLSESAAGQLTVTAPDAQGDFVVPVGVALSDTEFDIEIGAPIKL